MTTKIKPAPQLEPTVGVTNASLLFFLQEIQERTLQGYVIDPNGYHWAQMPSQFMTTMTLPGSAAQ